MSPNDKPEELRMDAYYYGFDRTGCDAVNRILSAVACAGKAFHSTEDWNDEAGDWGGKGKTPVEWIQNAANEAASLVTRLQQAEEALKRIAEGNLGDDPWQANYAKIRRVASEALSIHHQEGRE
jgi:hypothetical protein